MSETNGVDETKAQHELGAEDQTQPQDGQAEEARAPEPEQPNPAAGYDGPIPDHLTDEALDGRQIKKLAEERIAELQADIDGAKEQALRLAAELENTRRRAERERQEAAKYGITGFARDLLSVADNIHKAIELAPEDPKDMSAEGLKSLIGGIKMTERELLSVFERHGVKKIDPKGERFDPNVHQAIAQVPGGGIPKDHVADVAAPGFVIGDRVVRAAMVTVSTGAEAAPSGESGDGEG